MQAECKDKPGRHTMGMIYEPQKPTIYITPRCCGRLMTARQLARSPEWYCSKCGKRVPLKNLKRKK